MAGTTEPSFYEYMLQTQRFLADTNQQWVNPEDLRDYINRARREVALRTQSIRVITPVQGAITHIEVTHPGRHYHDPVVHISWPDAPSGEQPHPRGRRARARASHINGHISNIAVEDGGDGYFRPFVRIRDRREHEEEREEREEEWGHWEFMDDDREDERDEHEHHGHGARARAHTVPLLVTHGFQEVYPFKAIPLERFPGVAEVFAVKGISFIYMNYRYSIPVFNFSTYQAYVRIYPQQYLYVPTAGAQFGQGVSGSLYLYPIPSHMYQMEWDCFCLPQDMGDDQDFEAIPKPWTDAVPYFAAHLAYLGLQNRNAAQYFMALYDDMVHRYSAYARPGRHINAYGRWAAFT